MKGDFSRPTFHREKHYSKVNEQQGRVRVDADPNEQIDILHHYERTALQDVIGQSGVPKGEPDGFKIVKSANSAFTYNILKGRYYVHGILVENEMDVEATKQPDLPLSKDGKSLALPDQMGNYLLYLDVWERHITYLDDPEIKESALGGPDTSTRSKIVWQVKFHPIETPRGTAAERIDCQTPLPHGDSLVDRLVGTLIARTKPEITADDPCIIKPGAGYRGLENQLYRIEIHNPGTTGNGASFKWSRDNGIVITKASDITEKTITVAGIGKDRLLGFNNQQFIEVSHDRNQLLNMPGTFAKINVISENELAVLDGSVKGESLTNANFPQEFNPQIRRWDSIGGDIPVTIPSSNDGFIPIENGIEVKFQSRVEYRTGDYWYLPARTLIGDIEWPRLNNEPQPKPPDGVKHHFARLAVLKVKNDKTIEVVDDCRKEFPPLTDVSPSRPRPSPSTSANVSTWAHGNIVWVQKPTLLSANEKNAFGTVFKQGDRNNTFHFPLSTSFIIEENSILSKLSLTKVHLLYNATEGKVNIVQIQIFDGKFLRWTIGGSSDGSELTGDYSSSLVANKNSWDVNPPVGITILFGLGISVEVHFESNKEITFHSVGADFTRT